MAAVLAAGTLTGSVFASDFTTTGEVLSEESSNDYLNETNELIDETVPEDSALSIEPASADTDPAAVDEISSEAETEDEEGTEAVGEEEAEEETALENGQDSETPDDTGVPADETASFDGPIDETEDVSSDITDDGNMVSDEMPGADQETEEVPAPVQEDNAFTEDQTATEESAEFLTEEPAEFLTEEPAAVADPAPADGNEGQTADTAILEEPGTEETVSEEQTADGEGSFNPIIADVTSMELIPGQTGQIYLESSYNDSSYYEEMTSVQSSDSSVLVVKSYEYQYIEVFARKVGTAKVTIEGSYGTVLTVQVKVVSFLGKNSVTVKAEYKTTVYIYDYDYYGIHTAENNHYSVSTSNKNVATGSIVLNEDDYIYELAIKGIGLGNAVITVKDNNTGCISTISVKVEKPPFSLNKTEISFMASEIYELKASGSNIKTAVSSNTSIFTTEIDGGKSVYLIPVQPGTATVTLTNNYGDVKKATVTVTTFLRIKNLILTAGNIRDIDEMDLFRDYSFDWGKNLTSSNKNIVTVSGRTDYYSFKFKGQYPGKATITVTCGATNAISRIAVTVKAPAFNLSDSKLTINKAKTWQVTASGSDIGKVSSSNTKVLKVKKVNSRRVQFIPVAHGTATVTLTSMYGVKRTVSVAVSYNYFKDLLINKTRTGTMLYGYTVLRGITAPSATVSVRIGGKTYTARADSSGIYKILNIPVLKYGTNLKLTYKLCGTSITKTVTVAKGNSKVSSPYVYKDSTKVPVTVNNVHSGDKIIISIDGKQYTKTFTKAYTRTTETLTIKKPNKYGIKMVIKLNNKFNQQLASYSAYVYLRSMVRKGDTKEIVKWIPRWNSPSQRNVYSDWESWWYDDWMGKENNEANLTFDENGKVDDWAFYYY